MHCLFFQHLVFFQLTVTDFQFDSSVAEKHSLYDFNSFKLKSVLRPRIWSILIRSPQELGKNVYSAVVNCTVLYLLELVG